MGRITIFTGDDIHSKHLKMELEKRNLPFHEISLLAHPNRLKDLKALSSSMAVPQVFFNTRHVGGVGETVRELSHKWDKSSRFANARERFDAEIASVADPSSTMLATPDPSENSGPDTAHTEPNPEGRPARSEFKRLRLLPKGNNNGLTVLEVTEKLRNTLPANQRQYKNAIYPNSFSGKEAVQTFIKAMGLTESQAVDFGIALQEARIIDHVADFSPKTGQFCNSGREIYRLHCHKNPQLLNSYRVWNEPYANHMTPMEVVANLDHLMTQMETDSVNETGKVCYAQLSNSLRLPIFEEASCELQRISMKGMNEKERMAFAINVFRVMLRYAFLKVGVVGQDGELKTYFKLMKFNVGGNLYSFREWIDGLLRGNKRSYFSKTAVAFNRFDSRRKFSLPELDNRIHFALYAGCTYSCACSLPFRQFTAENLESELNIAASVFCSDPGFLDLDTDSASREVGLFKILDWYGSDFARNRHGILEELHKNVEGYESLQLRASLSDKSKLKIRINDLNLQKNLDESAIFQKMDVLPKLSVRQSRQRRQFVSPNKPRNENIRLETLRSLNVLDTLQEDCYDCITAEVKEYFDVPIVFVTLVDEDRQWFKSTQWCCPMRAPTETSRDISLCAHAVANNDSDMMVIPDTLQDDRFADNPLVTGPTAIRFYAGCALSVPAVNGSSEPAKVGTLCMIDQHPRVPLSTQEGKKLRAFGARVVKELVKDPASTEIAVPRKTETTDMKGDHDIVSHDGGDFEVTGQVDEAFSIQYNHFLPATETEDERIRAVSLRNLKVLDTPREERYDAITACAQKYFDVPIVLVSLVDSHRQWFKSAQWSCPLVPQPAETGRDISFCGHAINSGEDDVFVVPDASKDSRFSDNPLVSGPLGIRFYAAYVLSVPAIDGGPAVSIGTLCIIDQKPREMLSEAEVARLRTLGHQVEQEIIIRSKCLQPNSQDESNYSLVNEAHLNAFVPA